MSKLNRYAQKLFGSTAPNNSMSEFGSLANGTPARYSGATITPDIIQDLNYPGGWQAAVLGGNSPCIEDMNSLCYLFGYQLSYLMQQGIAEWNAATTYFIGSLVNDGSGIIYVSKTNNNLNNALSSTANWRTYLQAPTVQSITSGTGTYTTPAGVKYLKVKMIGSGGAGGGGSSTGAGNGSDGSDGNDTTFNSTLLVAGKGKGGKQSTFSGGLGGTNSFTAGPIILINTAGNAGQISNCTGTSPTPNPGSGGAGGLGVFGGQGAAFYGSSASAPTANSGCGGYGGFPYGSAGFAFSCGGGAGGYLEAIIASPSATYTYSVGAGATGGAAGGTSAGAGIAGASGLILVEEYYY